MQYNTRAFLNMIISAIDSERTQHEERTISHTILSENTLMIYTVDDREFRIVVEEAV